MIYITSFAIVVAILLCIVSGSAQKAWNLKAKIANIVAEVKSQYMLYGIILISGLSVIVLLMEGYGLEWVTSCKWACALMFVIMFAKKDKESMCIPNRLLVYLILWTLVFDITEIILYPIYVKLIVSSILAGCFLLFLFLMVCRFISKGGIGFGDVKLMSILGLLLGLRGAYNILLFTVLCGAVCGVYLMLVKKQSAKTSLPMAPFMVAGILIPVLMGA